MVLDIMTVFGLCVFLVLYKNSFTNHFYVWWCDKVLIFQNLFLKFTRVDFIFE
nr:hypothetical protein [Escherichia coli]